MIYFIDELQNGYFKNFDDILPRLSLFQGVAPTVLVTIDYAPTLFSQLIDHEQFAVAQKSLFDIIQRTENKEETFIAVQDLSFPPDATYIFVYEGVRVFENSREIAFVEMDALTHDRIQTVHLFDETHSETRTMDYDSRGFLSRVVDTETGDTYYLTPDGQTAMLVKNGRVTLAEPIYDRTEFESLDQLQTWFLNHLIRDTGQDDQIIMTGSLHLHNMYLGMGIERDRNVNFAISQLLPTNIVGNATFQTQVETVYQHAIISTLPYQKIFSSPTLIPVWSVAPNVGSSRQYKEDIVTWYVDGIPGAQMQAIYTVLKEMMWRLPNMALAIIGDGRIQQLDRWLHTDLGDDYEFPERGGYYEGWDEVQRKRKPRVHIIENPSQKEISDAVDFSRVLFDWSETPNEYVQALALIKQIPQIMHVPTKAVENGKNGLVVTDTADLEQAIMNLTKPLAVWNEARLATRVKGEQFNKQHLLSKWVALWGEQNDGTNI